MILPIILSFGYFDTDLKESCGKRLEGFYAENKIYICPELSKKEKVRVYFHEMAHFIYENLTKKQIKAWESLYDPYIRGSFVSFYALTNEEEDFCETYSYMMTKIDPPAYTELLTKKKKFIRAIFVLFPFGMPKK